MQNAAFIEMTANLHTTRENDAEGSANDSEATLDSLIGVARNLVAKAVAADSALKATELFDVLGDGILSCDRDALVVIRHHDVEVPVSKVDVREDAVVLDMMDRV